MSNAPVCSVCEGSIGRHPQPVFGGYENRRQLCPSCRNMLNEVVEQKLVAIREQLQDLKHTLEDLRHDHQVLRTEFDGMGET